MEIKLVNPKEHIDDISKLFFDVFTGEPWSDRWQSVLHAKNYLTNIINTPQSKCFIVLVNNNLTGFALGNIRDWYSGKELYISEMCVKKEKQGTGLGSELIKNIENHLKKEGVNTIILLTNEGTSAYNFYKKNNFKEIDSMKFLFKKIT